MSSNSTSGISNATNSSTSSFLTALWLNGAVFAAEIIAFTFLRPRFQSIYEPRTYIPIESKRTPNIGTSLFAWPLAVFNSDYDLIRERNGMDAYFFVRFLRMMVRVLLPIWFISWAVLLPITSVHTGQGSINLDSFTFGNIPRNKQSRYAAHIILVWIFTVWIWYNIKTEMRHFVTTRQRHLVDPIHSASAQANTVLITGIPTKFLSEKALTNLFSHLPGGVRKVWLNRDLKELPDVYDRRLAACGKLESAETSLINIARKRRNKTLKKEAKAAGKSGASTSRDGLALNAEHHISEGDRDRDAEKNIALAEQLVPRKKRPTHRLPLGFLPFSLPFVGQEVDSIEWAREEIAKTTEVLEQGRAVLRREAGSEDAHGRVGGIVGLLPLRRNGRTRTHNDGEQVAPDAEVKAEKPVRPEAQTYPPLNSAFILFNQQIAAHLAAQTLTHNEPYRMAGKYTEVAPADVIWGNLGLNPYEAKVRIAISYAVTGGLIILWAFPVLFVGIVSNIGRLCTTYSWLAWICKLPKTVLGIIEGILPPVLLAVLMLLLPIVLRLLARLEGIPRRTGLELSLMTRFFIFQVIHGFLIVTLAGGLIAALPQLIKNPTGIPSLLATTLPSASNFFLTYAILQGLAGTAAGFLQVVPLILYYVKLVILGSTPRSVYKIKFTMRDVAWGTLFPSITLIVVITLGYSIISPIINGLACATFFLFYMLWKYLFLWTLEQPASGDTGGLFFPKAIQHVFVGLYVQQICLAALFFLAQNENKKASAVPEGALMIVLIIFTAFFHLIINNSYGPLIHSLPLTLADKSYGMPRGSGEESVVIGQEDGGFGGDSGKDKASLSSSAERDHADADAEVAQHETRVAGKQPVKRDFGRAVAVEGKQNDGPTDFYHPASVEPQRIIWLPRDPLGLAEAEEVVIREAGIEVSCMNAHMDEKGNVDIDGPPPGMEPGSPML